MATSTHPRTVATDAWTAIVGKRLAELAKPAATYGTLLVLQARTWSAMEPLARHRDRIVAKVNKVQPAAARFSGAVLLAPGITLVNGGRVQLERSQP